MTTIGFPPPESVSRPSAQVPRQVRRSTATRDERHDHNNEDQAKRDASGGDVGPARRDLSDEEILKILRAIKGQRGTLVDKSV